MSLNGKVAVVTGAASGIGRGIAIRLAADGAAISVWDLNAAGAEETAELIRAAGGKAIVCAGDAAAKEPIAAAVARTHAELGPISILVNNAGMTGFDAFQTITQEHFEKVLRVNLTGPFLCIQAIIPDMLAAGWGRIINISSSSTETGAPMMAHYVSSKSGLIGLTKALAVEYADKGITVNNVPPGFIDTPMLRASPVDVDAYAATMPMKRPGKPSDIAGAVAYFASEEAGYVTGHTLSVNGGRYMN
ncbi:SDR family NAD(P)-dependent oxidoreductase [Phenylobacterium sp. LjRoot225]|uniref:SDR family NAD(P)-dependent oxidoreductase n=1 Tax=Phenylobacterium sp. LjRoot225 TaxID=3342285 RepID=UPI003ECD5F2F